MSPYDPVAAGASCDICPLRGGVVVPPEGNMNTALLALVGEGPGYNEVKHKRPFIGASGEKLLEILNELGIRRSDVFITNAVLCRPEVPGIEGRKKYDVPTYLAWLRLENRRRKKAKEANLPSPFDCCATRLMIEVQTMEQAAKSRNQPNGAVIMPLGNEAMHALIARRKISKWRGSPIVLDENGSPIRTDEI